MSTLREQWVTMTEARRLAEKFGLNKILGNILGPDPPIRTLRHPCLTCNDCSLPVTRNTFVTGDASVWERDVEWEECAINITLNDIFDRKTFLVYVHFFCSAALKLSPVRHAENIPNRRFGREARSQKINRRLNQTFRLHFTISSLPTHPQKQVHPKRCLVFVYAPLPSPACCLPTHTSENRRVIVHQQIHPI